MKINNRLLSFLLTIVMVITFVLPVSAMEIEPPENIIDMTGGAEMSSHDEDIRPDYTENEESSAESSSQTDVTADNREKQDAANSEDHADTPLGTSSSGATENGDFYLNCTPEQAAELIAFYEFVRAQIANQPAFQLFAAPGDGGTVNWTWGEAVGIDVPSGDPNNPYHIGNIPRITLTTANPPEGRPFCVEFGVDPGGSYTASKGSDSQILALLVAHQKGSASAVGVQLALWYKVNGLPLSTHPQAAAALSAASSVDTTGYTYLLWNSGSGQPFVTLDRAEDSEIPIPTDPPDDKDKENPNTETITDTSTETEVRITEEYTYSDAIGQITICKRDDKGVSLDGAIFNIKVEFANGEVGGDSAFEVYNGSRLFTYTHPADDHEPARITVTEVRAPDGYTGTNQPQTAIVHPTYTRVTKVTTATITITTTTTTVVDIDTGEILAESEAKAETETSPPIVKEHTDFIEGDREMTLTYVNTPKSSSLTIYKYEKGSYSTPLAGARFRIRYADISVSAQVWERTTGADGKIIIDPLPAAGTLVIEELEAPGGYEIGEQNTFTITVTKGEHKQLDVSNEKRASLVVYKKDAVSGQLLQGAVFKATMIGTGIVKTAESGSDGRAVFTDLIPGEWRIEEQTPPPYFLPTTKVETVHIPDGSYKTLELTFENQPYSGLTIRKVSYQDGRGLKGAVFGLYRGSEAHPTDFLGEYQTDDNGRIFIDKLESNQYYTVKELQPPVNHLLDEDDTRTILIKPDAVDNNITLIFRNKEKPKILIEKVDDLGNPVANCTFKVSRRDSAEFVEVTTGSDGTVLVEGLYEDWYQITEIRAADGVIISSEVKDVQTEAGKTTTVQFVNFRSPTLTIQKIDAATGHGLDGAVIRIWREGVDEHQDYTTTGGGYIRLRDQSPGTIICKEIKSPEGYLLSDEEHRLILEPGGNHTLTIQNHKQPTLTIRKIDEQTGAGVEGVVLRITKDGAMEYRDVTTGKDGVIVLTDMEPGWVTIVEQKAKDGYILDQSPHHIQLKPGENHEIIIKNKHKPSLKIIKLDSVTKQPLQYVTFSIGYKHGNPIGEFTTDANGEIYLEDIDPGTVVITETKGRAGYIIDGVSREVVIEWGKVATVEIFNTPKNPLFIKKVDAKTGEPLAGAVFTVTKVNGEFVGEFTTGRNGFITVTGIEPGFYTVRETKSPDGFILDDTPKTVELKLNQPAEVTFENKPLNGIQISKIDADTREPLEGVKFVVREKGGRHIGEFTTNRNGLIDVPDLEPGWFQVYESATLPGYLLDSNVVDVELLWNDHKLLEFTNHKLSGLQIRKTDAVTGDPIQGVKFRLNKISGELVGDYTTNAGGFIAVSDLEPGWYTAFETATIPGYILDATPQNIEIKKNDLAVLEFTNRPLTGLQIRKSDAVTGEPLAGVEFSVTELSGARIGSFTTDSSGIIFVPDLKEGWYVVSEVKGLPGYKPDTAPRNVELRADRLNVLEYKNQPYPVFQLQKVDADTLQPLEGVRFRLLDNSQREIGIFTTNAQGKIILTGMNEGTYYLQETEAKQGYVLDSTVREIALQWGKTTSIGIKNTPMASLRIKKVDAVSGKPVPGTTFLLYDMKGNILGEYLTDDKGMIELPKTLAAGKYKLKESKAAPGYVLDDQSRTIELKSGETTEIVIENQPVRGKITIVKKSDADNPITKQKSGAVLEGAMFEVYDKDLNLVDTITTDSKGIATTIDLPLGTYGIKETEAPDYFFTEGKVFYAEIKLHGDVVKFEVLNTPADISVTVEKRGNVEVIAGNEMRYDFSNIANTSNITLDQFYWHDALPTDAVRLKTIHTGTWSESLTYSVTYRTNLKSAYRTLADNLTSKQNHTLDCTPAKLKLAANEYITDIRFEFGTVQPGFHEIDAPSFVVNTLATLPDGYRIVNKTDVGGKTEDKWVTAQDTWITIALGKPKGDLPKTGY
ncbi:hypothetical protein LJC63_00580 [Ruminococcaceae bacterium OttesenSCG-928-L11]|nr:hypothetical protein [Ruminococcaceae bacterium OttesenSCG-928-L11]